MATHMPHAGHTPAAALHAASEGAGSHGAPPAYHEHHAEAAADHAAAHAAAAHEAHMAMLHELGLDSDAAAGAPSSSSSSSSSSSFSSSTSSSSTVSSSTRTGHGEVLHVERVETTVENGRRVTKKIRTQGG
jgi:hypothetical protein